MKKNFEKFSKWFLGTFPTEIGKSGLHRSLSPGSHLSFATSPVKKFQPQAELELKAWNFSLKNGIFALKTNQPEPLWPSNRDNEHQASLLTYGDSLYQVWLRSNLNYDFYGRKSEKMTNFGSKSMDQNGCDHRTVKSNNRHHLQPITNHHTKFGKDPIWIATCSVKSVNVDRHRQTRWSLQYPSGFWPRGKKIKEKNDTPWSEKRQTQTWV